MRIRFAARIDDPEGVAKRQRDTRIDALWTAVGSALAPGRRRLTERADLEALERTLSAHAARIDPGVRIEVDVPAGDQYRVVVSSAADGALEPLLGEVVKRAPQWSGTTVVRHRPELSVASAVADVQARLGVDLSAARARIGFARGHLLEVVVYAPTFGSATDERALDAANLLVARLLGEELFDDWVGSIDVAPLPRGGPLRVLSDGAPSLDSTLPLGEVLSAAEAGIRGVYAELPEAPYHTFCEHAEWTLLELEPELAPDYAAQEDVALVSTMLPEAMKCFLQGSPFASRRFSKRGERFAYAKIDTLSLSMEERHALRLELEDSLNVALVPGRIGCVVGAGIGARYLYLDLAFESLDHGVRVTCDRLRKHGVDRRSWVLFCDSGWSNEWAGVYEDGEAPPGLTR